MASLPMNVTLRGGEKANMLLPLYALAPISRTPNGIVIHL